MFYSKQKDEYNRLTMMGQAINKMQIEEYFDRPSRATNSSKSVGLSVGGGIKCK